MAGFPASGSLRRAEKLFHNRYRGATHLANDINRLSQEFERRERLTKKKPASGAKTTSSGASLREALVTLLTHAVEERKLWTSA